MIPTCPWCGHHDRAIQIHHPNGRYFCACGSLFNGGDTEWRRLAQHRREAAERNAAWLEAHPRVDRVDDHIYEEAS